MKEEKDEFVVCKVCGFKSKRIYGRHLKSHNITSEEYKKMFPGEPLYTESDNKNTSKNSGKHMKEEKYKIMFSEKIKGDKNPNSKLNTTLEQRKSRSPFSNNFIKYSKLTEKKREKTLKLFIKEVCDKKTYEVRLDYWINKGYSEEDALLKLKKRQTTFTLEICIQKYGEIEGKRIYTERQDKWQDSLLKNGNLKYGYSNISQVLFNFILEYYTFENKEQVYFATKNQEYRLEKENGGVWLYDFVDLKNKKIIEYNGDQYHANPNIFEPNDFPHPFIKDMTAQEIWNKDERKRKIAEKNGIDMLIIWDSEYKSQKINTLEKCKKYLNL